MEYKFPKDFIWGGSSSAFQIEGGYDEGSKGLSVADYNSFQKSNIQADSKVASDFYHHWREDIALFKELGIQMYRFSIAWTRIIPDGDGEINQEGIRFYNDVINELLKHDIKPFITLYHFDLPFKLVEKYNGWEDRRSAYAFENFATACFEAFGDRVSDWQVHNEQNLMIRVNERMNIYNTDGIHVEKVRAQMDYHMFLAHFLAIQSFRKIIKGGKIGPAISATVTYPATNKPEDVWAARMNDNFKTNYALDVYIKGAYPGYFLKYLEEQDIMFESQPEDVSLFKDASSDFIAINYYRTLVAEYLPFDETHPKGLKSEAIDFDMYGYFKILQNEHLKASEYGAQIDPSGLRIALNDYYERYHLPLIITENGLGTPDVLENGKVHDSYRIDYIDGHIKACHDAISDGVELLGYSPWSVMDLLSSHQGFKKRYGFIYVDRTDFDLKALQRVRKESFFWYKNVIENHGIE